MADASLRPITKAGTFLGIGMGGFLDGILLHQIVQAHNMLSAKIPVDTMVGMRTNMRWDGLFHLFTWVITLLGIVMLWRAVARTDVILSDRAFAGSILFGWGLFNLVEGIINHHILGLHHVIETLGVSVWDWLFLASGAILMLAGRLIARDSRRGDSR